MKLTLTLCLASWLSSCAVGPHADITTADGVTIRIGTSNSVASKQENVVASAEVTLPSGHKVHLKQSVKKQDAENVPLMGLAGYFMNAGSKVAAGVATNASNNATAEVLGAQQADVAKHATTTAAGVSGATVVNPNIALPLRK